MTKKTFQVKREWHGYSRGYTIYEVQAESEEEAIDNYDSGEEIEHCVVRDDTETSDVDIY